MMDRDPKQKQTYWSRREHSKGPVIIVNDVTYRSPDEMPEDVRAIWDIHARRWEEQGMDWREQHRIVLSWGKEGGRIRQSVNIEGRPQISHHFRHVHRDLQQSTTVGNGAAFGAYVVCFLVLFFYALMWDDPPLVRTSGSAWLPVAFCVLLAPWLWLTINVYRLGRPTKLKSAVTMFGMLVAVVFMAYVAVFAGVARLLHYTEQQAGEVTATVAAKYAYARRNSRCAPRIEFQGFHFAGDVLCVNTGFFKSVKVGDRVRMTGKVSRFAIQPDELAIANGGSN